MQGRYLAYTQFVTGSLGDVDARIGLFVVDTIQNKREKWGEWSASGGYTVRWSPSGDWVAMRLFDSESLARLVLVCHDGKSIEGPSGLNMAGFPVWNSTEERMSIVLAPQCRGPELSLWELDIELSQWRCIGTYYENIQWSTLFRPLSYADDDHSLLCLRWGPRDGDESFECGVVDLSTGIFRPIIDLSSHLPSDASLIDMTPLSPDGRWLAMMFSNHAPAAGLLDLKTPEFRFLANRRIIGLWGYWSGGLRDLKIAASSGSLNTAQSLISHGADTKATDDDDETPLHEAARSGSLKTAQLLIDHGANVNATDCLGMTPLLWALTSKDLAITRLLIDRGADMNATDRYGIAPLYRAASSGDLMVAKLLISHGANVNVTDGYGTALLHKTARSADLKTAQLLIEHGADTNATDRYGVTPLHDAASSGSLEVAKLLIENGANVNATNKHGTTPLRWANRGSEIAELLRQHGAKE